MAFDECAKTEKWFYKIFEVRINMKVRTDYVSNSSSSSFVLCGIIYTRDEILKLLSKSDRLDDVLKLYNKQYDEKCNSLEEICESGYIDVDNIVDMFIEASKANLDSQYEYFDQIDGIALGLDPSSKMKDNQTLKEFKQNVVEQIKKLGINAKIKDVEFVTGGSDASGMSFFGDVG